MAFMMPVVKNDWDIYKSQRSTVGRRSSERSDAGSSRKVYSRSECPSLSTSPGSAADFFSPAHRSSGAVAVPRNYNSSRTSSRASLQSPSKASSTASSSPPKTSGGGSQSSLNKFHTRLVDRLKRSFRSSSSDDSSRSSS